MAYYNQSGLSFIPPTVKIIIIINIACFVLQNVYAPTTEFGALHYWTSPLFKPHQLVTNMFLHGSIPHIFFNMYSFWIFGSTLENFWGSKRFLNFYMICGIGASIAVLLFIPFTAAQIAKTPGLLENGETISGAIEMYKQQYAALGASGAVMGVMAGSAYLFPNRELIILPFPFPIKVKYLVPFYILGDLFGGFGRAGLNDGIAHFAHLGGALVGFLIVFFWNKTNRKNFY
jgi:membrane associated rhomboid family serine protease